MGRQQTTDKPPRQPTPPNADMPSVFQLCVLSVFEHPETFGFKKLQCVLGFALAGCQHFSSHVVNDERAYQVIDQEKKEEGS